MALKKTVLVVLVLLFTHCQWVLASQDAVVKGETDWMKINEAARKVVFTASVTKNSSKAAVSDWGQRGQAWIGCKGGSQEKFFIFTTDVAREKIDAAIRGMGVKHSHQIEKKGWKKRKDLKESTTHDDFLDGDPVIVSVRFTKDGKIVQMPLENLIDEKIEINKKEVRRPHTPHYIYHGTGEAIHYPSGCVVCPSDCFGGIITDNRLPILTYDSWYRVAWDKMPAVGEKVEIVLQFATQ